MTPSVRAEVENIMDDYQRKDICEERHKHVGRAMEKLDKTMNRLNWLLIAALAGIIVDVATRLAG